MGQLRIHNLTEAEEVTGDEKLVLDDSSFSNALSLTLNKLATWVLGRTTSETHAETLYYNYIAEREYFDGEPVVIQGTNIFIGIALDHVKIGENLRIAYAGKVQVLVHASIAVNKGDIAGFRNTGEIYEIAVVNMDEPYSILNIVNIVGIFLEDSSAGEDRLVWVLLKL